MVQIPGAGSAVLGSCSLKVSSFVLNPKTRPPSESKAQGTAENAKVTGDEPEKITASCRADQDTRSNRIWLQQ
ncbi:hypothetical protein DXK94_07890 [Arthrobacter sp. RT-1]|nr:hypothetical protein DXK94_07890 [Arthrobacter sp. RT-1]